MVMSFYVGWRWWMLMNDYSWHNDMYLLCIYTRNPKGCYLFVATFPVAKEEQEKAKMLLSSMSWIDNDCYLIGIMSHSIGWCWTEQWSRVADVLGKVDSNLKQTNRHFAIHILMTIILAVRCFVKSRGTLRSHYLLFQLLHVPSYPKELLLTRCPPVG